MAQQRTPSGQRAGIGSHAASAPFVRALRAVLWHLYDPVTLRQSSLIPLLGIGQLEDPPARLRSLLIEAMESFKPARDVPPQASAWRAYRILYERFVEQFSQREVATHLAVGTRQLRRQEAHAVRALADWLWNHYDVASRVPDAASSPPRETGEETPSREQELEWLRTSYPDEAVAIDELLRATLYTVDPLLQALKARLDYAVPPGLPQVAAQLTSLRHALANVLTAAIQYAAHGQLRIEAEVRGSQVCIQIWATGPAHGTLSKDDRENLDLAQRIAEFSRGSLEVRAHGPGEAPFCALLRLPAAAQVKVLVVDDNLDTLRLVERHLAGTRYAFTGLADPQQVVAVAEDLAPEIILLDVMLPGVDGWQLLGRLREHPRLGAVPVLVYTILAQEQLALALGAAAFVRKPVSRSALLQALDQLMDRKRIASDSAPRCR